MKPKWLRFHVLFFTVTWIYNYVFNFYLMIPSGRLLIFSAYFLIDNIIMVGYFYTIMFLSPFFLKRRIYFIPAQLLFMVSGCLILSILPYSFYLYAGFEMDFLQVYFIKMFDVTFITFSSLSFLFLQKWDESATQKLQLIESLFHAELTFLYSQMSPHFLLNTLNSIYSLALNKSPEIYPAIAELKKIYSYLQRNEGKVSLKDEIDYLENFIKIQKRRFGNAISLSVNFSLDQDYQIEPLLLSSFVENAFKHGVSIKEYSFIDIQLQVSQGKLEYKVYNSDHSKKYTDYASGIGLQNLSRRLELLYPGNFSLSNFAESKSYGSFLTIQQL